jgi:hypothetical protein
MSFHLTDMPHISLGNVPDFGTFYYIFLKKKRNARQLGSKTQNMPYKTRGYSLKQACV